MRHTVFGAVLRDMPVSSCTGLHSHYMQAVDTRDHPRLPLVTSLLCGDADMRVVSPCCTPRHCSARDVVRPEAAEAVAMLDQLGCSAAMLTGDASAAAQAVGAAVGLPADHVHAQLLPEQKLSKVG